MNFKFLKYNEDIFEYVTTQENYSFDTLFICENLSNKNVLQSAFDKNSKNLVLTKEEFLNEIKKGINDDNIRLFLFFLSLNKDNKKRFRINDIFECKDLFSRFKSLYRELMEADIEKPKALLEWQEKIFSEMKDIKEDYLKFLNKNFIKDFIFNNEFEISFLDNFNNLVFVNVIYYSNLDKKIFNLLKGKNINLVIQAPENNFDKEQLKLVKVDLPKECPKMEIFKTNDDFLQAINILKDLTKNTRIVDLKGEGFLYSIDNFTKSNETFDSTNIFNFLENVLKLLKGVRIVNKDFTIKSSALLNVVNSIVIKKYFKISENEIKRFNFFVRDGYKYIPKDELFNNLFNFIEKIYYSKSFDEFYNSFYNFKIDDEIEIFYETLDEFKNIINEFVGDNWNKIFKKNFSRKLLTLFLQIVSDKEIKKDAIYKIEKIGEESYKNFKETIIMNLSDAFIKFEELEKNILTDMQKSNNNIKDYSAYSLEYRYKILRAIFSSEIVKVYYIKDVEKNIDSYPLIEEIKLKFNIKEDDLLIDEKYYKHIFDILFQDREILKIGRDDRDPLPFDKEDLVSKNEYSLSFYDFSEFEKCQYKYYLKYIACLDSEISEIKYRIDPSLIGEIAHKLLSRIAVLMNDNLKQGIYNLKGININKILNGIVKEEQYKIAITYYNFYRKILFPSIVSSVKNFYKCLQDKLNSNHIKDIFVEKASKYHLLTFDDKPFFLKGKADLVIDADDKSYIIDYKSGKGDSKQLDFYKIIYYNLSFNLEKMFYKIFEGDLKREKKEILKEENLKEKISTFFKSAIYKRTDKISRCRTCEYFNICHSIGE